MLKKNTLNVGATYEVRSDRPLSNGLSGFQQTIPVVSARAGYVAGDSNFALSPGDQCQLLHGPKKVNGVNIVQVKSVTTGVTGCVFWCEFRCNLLEPKPKAAFKI